MERRVGPWRLVRRLGAGGMGEVFLAEHLQGGQPCALKLLALGDEDEALRFAREGRAVAAAGRHPHVVEVLQLGREKSFAYLALELVEGGDLAGLLEERGPLTPEEACRLTREAAQGIAHMHERGVLHRDLKPHNVLLTREQSVKVTDFGLARLSGAETLTRSGEVLGTPVYMAPEQAKGEVAAYGLWTDVYGLGGVLYACLTGRPPIESRGSVLATLRAVLEEAPAPPSSRNRAVPTWLDEVCLRALAKEPRERFASARELADALRGPAQDRAGRRPSRLALLAAPLLMLSAGAIGFALAASRPSPLAEASPRAAPGATPDASPVAFPVAFPSDPPGFGAEAQARSLAKSQASARELIEAWQAALAAATDQAAQERCLLELLRASHRRNDLAVLELTTEELQRRGVHEGEAIFRLGDALCAGRRWEEGLQVLTRLEGRPEPWAALGAARRGLERSLSRSSLLALADRVHGLLEGAEEEARFLLARQEALLRWTGSPFGLSDHNVRRRIKRGDVHDLIFAARLLVHRQPNAEQLAQARDFLSLAREICASSLPLGSLGECELYLATASSAADERLLTRFEQSAANFSPWRRAKLLLNLGHALEERVGPIARFRAWSRIELEQGEALLRDWRERAGFRAEWSVEQRVRGEAFVLRLGRAVGQSAQVPEWPGAAAQVEAWLEELQPSLRALGRAVLSEAIRGATWNQLAGRVQQLARAEDPLARLLAAEVALGRMRLGFGGAICASFKDSRWNERAALTLLLLGRGRVEAGGFVESAHGEALLRAYSEYSAARFPEAEAALELAAAGPAWCRRLSAHLQVEIATAQDREPQTEPWTQALHARQYYDLCMLRSVRQPEVWEHLARTIRALRIVSHPVSRLILVEQTATLSKPLRDGLADSRGLWLAEARLEIEKGRNPALVQALERQLWIAAGLDLLARGGSAGAVRAQWEQALQRGGQLEERYLDAFARRFGEPFR